ncbi:MAG: carbamoyltransferase HypF, partial [Gammaproteobacteria bacterium]
FVYRLAREHGLTGWVRNAVGRVEIHAQGSALVLDAFGADLPARAPSVSEPEIVSVTEAEPAPFDSFSIWSSDSSAEVDVHVPVDRAICSECLAELSDRDNRRYRYPFTNCTQCGPRYTLIAALPYDRPNTSMADFPLCADCGREYADPEDRRFHAEPNACPECGPSLQFHSDEEFITGNEGALSETVAALRCGQVVAVKGIGGYHLMCDAANEVAVQRLRDTKPRPDKPLALMVPETGRDGCDGVRRVVKLEPEAQRALTGPARPIVLLPRQDGAPIAEGVAPGLSEIGVMLPYSPLHQVLLADFGRPLVATSANISGEPVLTDEVEVERRLGHVTRSWLHHDRPVLRPADDPVFRLISGRPRPLRLGRGVAPLELTLSGRLETPVLALGGHMKNAIALAWGERVVLSPHIGDLQAPRSRVVFEQVIDDLQRLYQVQARTFIHDAHPGYASSRWAAGRAGEVDGLALHRVQHHRAHASALAGDCHGAEALTRTGLVFTWDGVGYGDGGELWGGEAFVGAPGRWRRVAGLRPFRLPGGEKAGREPWRSAASLAWATGRDWGRACPTDIGLLQRAWERGVNSPWTSAAGRVFDAASAFLGLADTVSFEGQGPMRLEARAEFSVHDVSLPLSLDEAGILRVDWAPLVDLLLDDGSDIAERAGAFHNSLARSILDQTHRIAEHAGFSWVGLTGGVFQNRLLSELTADLLEAEGFEVHLARQVPMNDGGIAYGQVLEFLGSLANPGAAPGDPAALHRSSH